MTLTLLLDALTELIADMPDKEKIEVSNRIRTLLHQFSPFSEEPVDCVQWVCATEVEENNYNPNQVAPAENRLLYTSLLRSGFTQPLVVWQDKASHYTLIDGFHRFFACPTAEQVAPAPAGLYSGCHGRPQRIR